MARKKQEIALQAEINTQEEWDELMKKEGLLVVDVYQDWCGPCKAVINFFRRVKNEIGDDFLNFAVAKADSIDSLEKYRGKCEPCFLIYGGRSLVGVIRGANPPVLESTIKLKLEEEHKVMKGEMERNETKDPFLAEMETEEKVQEVDKDVEEIEREITLALIKPDVVRAGKVDEIIAKLQESGIEILAQQERNLTIEEAKEFYHHMSDSEFFEDLIKFIASGPSKILVLAKGDAGIIHEFRELIGPKVMDEAKETAPESIRAVYGSNSIENAIHGADNKENALRELAFFFPDFMVPKISRKKHEVSNVQRTLALIRPAAFVEYRDSIIEKINNSGFKISMQKEVQLTKEDAALFYKVHKEKPFFEELITEMSKGTLLALALEKQNAVQGWRGMLGPKDVEKAKEVDPNSLRAQFSKEDIKINLLHGSDSEESAESELKYFFPVEQTIAALKPDGIANEDEITNRILDAKFKIVKKKTIQMDQTLATELYSDQVEQEHFNDLIAHMESGPTVFMVLSREDAIRGWRSLIGPKDPSIAAETYPDSIRAIYGKDISANAVYGSDNESEVQRVMNLIFGHLEFHKDGTLLPEYEDKPEITETTEQEITETEKDELEKKKDSEETTNPEISEQTEVKDSDKQSAAPENQNDKIDESENIEKVVSSRRGSPKNKEHEEKPVEHEDTAEKPVEQSDTIEKPIEHSDTTAKPVEHEDTTEKPVEREDTAEKHVEHADTTEKSDSPLVESDHKENETEVEMQSNRKVKEEETVIDEKSESYTETKEDNNEKSKTESKEVKDETRETEESEKENTTSDEVVKEKHEIEKTEETDKIEDTSEKEEHKEKSVNEQTEIDNTTDNTVQETENEDKTKIENEILEPDNANNENTNPETTEMTNKTQEGSIADEDKLETKKDSEKTEENENQ